MEKSILKLTLSMIILALVFNFTNQDVISKEKSQDKNIIARIGNETVTFEDIEKAFRKNMNRKGVGFKEIAKDSLMDFLKLYINYRLKVNDALSRGFEKDSSVLADIAQNRKLLAENYFYEKKLVDPNVNRILKLRETEMQVAIILIFFDTKNSETDTNNAFKKAMHTIQRIQDGESFEKLAKEVSDDKESAKNGGLIPSFITAGKVQRPIEDALYSIKKEGDIYPTLIKTRAGYFIIKLIKKSPRTAVLARHILLSEGLDKDSARVIKKADSLIALLKKGADFDKLAEENSDDAATALKGGLFSAYYNRATGFEIGGKMILPDLEKTIFNLKDGEISDKIITDLGLHIIKRESTKIVDVNNDREDIKKLYKRLYFEDDKRKFLDSLKTSYKFEIYEEVLDKILKSIDTSKSNLEPNWQEKIPSKLLNKDIYKIFDKKVKVSEILDMIKTKQELKALPLNEAGWRTTISRLTDPIVFDEASKNLESDYPDFALLIKEFRDGILLFRVEAIEVWEKMKFDSSLARKFYDTTKSRYKTEPKYDISEIYLLSDSAANDIYSKITAGGNFQNLAQDFTQRAGYREKKGNWGFVSSKNNKLAKIVEENNAKVGDVIPPKAYEKGFSIIKVNDFQPTRPKTFEESITDFAPEFQDLMQRNLTESWLNKIKKDIKVEIYNDTINKILGN